MAQIGLKDVHFAKHDSQAISGFADPEALAPALTANIKVNTTRSVLHADDQALETVENFVDVDVEINVSDLSTAVYAELLGKTIDANGVVIDTANDVAPYIGLAFRSEKSNGEYRYIWLYKGKFSVPNDVYNSKKESTEFQTATLTGKFIPMDNAKWRARVDSDDPTVTTTTISTWFDAVYL